MKEPMWSWRIFEMICVYWPTLALLLAACNVGAASPDQKELMRRAESGDAQAQVDLARRFDSGDGVPRDGAAATKWYLAAATQGNADAQNSMGSLLQAERRYAEALHWYDLAAAQGDALAINNLAYLYDLGLGIAQDRGRAFELYTRSANAGEPRAMLNLGMMYGAGQHVDKDPVLACAWIGRAQRLAGNDMKLLERAAEIMRRQPEILRPSELRACRKLVADWQPRAS